MTQFLVDLLAVAVLVGLAIGIGVLINVWGTKPRILTTP